MAIELSSLDVHFLVKELQELLGLQVEKVYGWGNDELLLKLHSRETKRHLRIKMPGVLHLTKKEYVAPMTPPGFCAYLRKYITNSAVKSVSQHGFERIVVIELDSKKNGSLSLVIELFKPGNVVLCKHDSGKPIVMQPLQRQQFKDREILPGKEYVFPPALPNLSALSGERIAELLASSGKSAVKALAIDLGFGGKYAEEIIHMSGVDKGKPPSRGDALGIASSVKELLSSSASPCVSGDSIYTFRLHGLADATAFDSISGAIDSVAEIGTVEATVMGEKPKSMSIVEAQQKRIAQLEREVAENQHVAEFIYENYKDFSALLEFVKSMRSRKAPWSEIKKRLAENKHFRELDEKEKKIILEF